MISRDTASVARAIGERRISTGKKIAFSVLIGVTLAVPFGVWWTRCRSTSTSRGMRLNQVAWEATYRERGLAVPAGGPRDGFWGERVFPKVPHPATVWREPTVDLPGILEIDAHGFQTYTPRVPAKFEVLFVGGSTASGTYASVTARTYFALIGRALERDDCASAITVFAGGAWKSSQDVAAFRYVAETRKRLDLVVFLHGLNDLTNGTDAATLYGVPTRTKNGSRWTPLYHEHDYDRRVQAYLDNMRSSIQFAQERGIAMLIVLQPALFERQQLSDIEKQALDGALLPHRSQAALVDSYEKMRVGLGQLAVSENVVFHDCSRLFDGERCTTFTDMWHFSDAGHEILATELAPHIERILAARPDGGDRREARTLRAGGGDD